MDDRKFRYQRAILHPPGPWEEVTESYVREQLGKRYKDPDNTLSLLRETGVIATSTASYSATPESALKHPERWVQAMEIASRICLAETISATSSNRPSTTPTIDRLINLAERCYEILRKMD